jgi:hypothetical protein
MARILTALVFAAALGAARASSSDELANREDFDYSANMPTEMAKAQVNEFKAAVASRSCFRVAAMTRFPLRLDRDGKSTWIDNRTALCRYFPVMFNEANSQIIANQKYNQMGIGWRGMMFGRGELWLTPGCATDPRKFDCPEPERRLWLAAVRVTD